MAASIATIDPRPSVFGDRMIITGSYTAADTGTLAIDLSSQLSSIDWAGSNFVGDLNPVSITDTGGASNVQDVFLTPSFTITDGTTLSVASGVVAYPSIAGTFIVIGRRS
tara:strand:+ start:163 stop:492 length:330 start_codon:yes stop_codon:yes gene_type:complete